MPLSRTESSPLKLPPRLQVAEQAGGGECDLHVAGIRRGKLELRDPEIAADHRSLTREIHAATAGELDEIGLREAQRFDREQIAFQGSPGVERERVLAEIEQHRIHQHLALFSGDIDPQPGVGCR